MDKKIQGIEAELIAQKYLQRKGLTLREKNFHCRLGEIDLIMNDGHTIVFVEVRYRRRNNYGDGAESVDKRKQRKISLAALFYLQKYQLNNFYCRFDVVSLSKGSSSTSVINWIENAFEHTG